MDETMTIHNEPAQPFDTSILFRDPEMWMDHFGRRTYEESFNRFMEKFSDFFEWTELSYSTVKDDSDIRCMAEKIVSGAEERFKQVGARTERERFKMTLNMYTVTYVIPGILKSKNGYASQEAAAICESWAAHFPDSHIKSAGFDEINSGFKNKLCYITTAVCDGMHKPENCDELRKLKEYRDSYLAKQPDGQKIIDLYYDIAPTIVKRIGRSGDPDMVYNHLWTEYIDPCIKLIDEGKNEECRELYSVMVKKLSREYFITNTHDQDQEGGEK